MGNEVNARRATRTQRLSLLGIAAVIVVFSTILLFIMESSQIQTATAIVALVLLATIAMVLYFL